MKRLAFAALAAFLGSFAPWLLAATDEASVVRGGRLYDNWSLESKERFPNGSHPSFIAKGTSVPAADTWRCKECHGYDYKGNHGMPGIRGRQGGDVAAIVAVLKDATHRYGGLMREGDLFDLANFVSHGQVDMQAAIEAGRHSKATNMSFEKYFGTLCGGCHGLDGRGQREFPPLGDAARQRPYQVLHSIFNGHAGDEMPALRLLGSETAARMLSFLQTLPTINLSVSIARGGRLYDNWQAEEGSRRPALPHPSYPRTAHYANDVQLTWRCKECHGWDYQGSLGDYASGQHATGIKGIRGLAGADPAQIETILRNTTHQYGTVLKDRDLRDLANFVRQGQVDMNAVIDRQTKLARGDAKRGAGYYQTICAGCHGGGGKRITSPLGRLATANPWGVLHMMLNGHPDEKMPALRELDQYVLIDILAYAQGLQEAR